MLCNFTRNETNAQFQVNLQHYQYKELTNKEYTVVTRYDTTLQYRQVSIFPVGEVELGSHALAECPWLQEPAKTPRNSTEYPF